MKRPNRRRIPNRRGVDAIDNVHVDVDVDVDFNADVDLQFEKAIKSLCILLGLADLRN